MYKKVRLKLTILFTGIAGLILAVMSLFYLYMSEKELKHNQFLSFCTEVNTIIFNLEQQDTISYEWISKAAANERCTIAIYDREIPLTHTSTVLSEAQQRLAAEFLLNCSSCRKLRLRIYLAPQRNAVCRFRRQEILCEYRIPPQRKRPGGYLQFN